MKDESDATQTTSQAFYFAPQSREIIGVLLSSFIVALVAFGLAKLFSQFALVPLFCKQSTTGVCATPFTFSFNTFLVIGQVAALIWFAKKQVFRPALIVIPAVAIMWSLPAALVSLYVASPLVFIGIAAVLATVSNLVFYWLVRFRSFLLVLVVWLALTILVRWLLVS